MTTELDRIKALESELAALKAQISARAESEVKKVWNPSGGSCVIDLDGRVRNVNANINEVLQFGAYYPTHRQAEQAATAMRKHNRLLAYVTEAIAKSDNPNWVADWSNKYSTKYRLAFDHYSKHTISNTAYYESGGTVYMPENIARELVVKLNSGEVVL